MLSGFEIFTITLAMLFLLTISCKLALKTSRKIFEFSAPILIGIGIIMLAVLIIIGIINMFKLMIMP